MISLISQLDSTCSDHRAKCRNQCVFSTHSWWLWRIHMNWGPCCPCWRSLHAVLPTPPRSCLPTGVCMLSVGSCQLKGTLSRESWSLSHILCFIQMVSLSSLCALGQQCTGSLCMLGSHVLQHDPSTWGWRIVQEPSPFPPISVTDWQ